MKTSITVAFAALLTACSQPAPVPAGPSTKLEYYVVGYGPCENGFVEITAAVPACGIALQPNGSLLIGDRRTQPIVVSHQQSADGDVAIAAKKLVLFPPALKSGFRIIQACDDADPNGLCWAVRLLNLRSGALQDVVAGKYGPELWVDWSPAERRVVLISRNEGAEWLHIVDTTTGAATTYPAESENANWLIDRESFAWTSDDAFQVNVKTCETCASLPRSFTLP
jgi:hypothetical protein